MQETTFLKSLNNIEAAVEDVNGIYESIERETEKKPSRSHVRSAFKAVSEIRKYFYSETDQDFSMPEMDKIKEVLIASNTDPKFSEKLILAQKEIIQESIVHLKSKSYFMSNDGKKINLDTKPFKSAISKISDFAKKL